MKPVIKNQYKKLKKKQFIGFYSMVQVQTSPAFLIDIKTPSPISKTPSYKALQQK